MSLASELDFSANIRTHGAIVGVILALNAIVTLRIRAAWDQTAKKEDLPNGVESIDQLKAVLLIQGIAEALLAVIFWIGFLKYDPMHRISLRDVILCYGVFQRIRWCLTVIVGYIAVWLVQLFRIRWCLTVFVGFIAVVLTLAFI
uniref:Uncharacterized protein n=1 Tax=Anopheles dirus TaxID=7168 RepID=A0A182NMX4_9DIPT